MSVLKQAKWRELSRAAGDTRGKRALDLGTDNGVISLALSQQGGTWESADLTAACRARDRPHARRARATEIRDARLPYADATFDLIVVADMLEHVADDRALLAEIARCLKVGGRAVLNVPRLKPLGVLHPLRRAIGLTDAWHGHLHSGYDARALRAPAPADAPARDHARIRALLLLRARHVAQRGERPRAAPGSTIRTAKGTVSAKRSDEKPVGRAVKMHVSRDARVRRRSTRCCRSRTATCSSRRSSARPARWTS